MDHYTPHACQKNKIPKDLFNHVYKIIHEEGYLCYHDDWGCNYILSQIVDLLHNYKITEED